MTEKVTAIMAARKSSGFTQTEAANMMGISTSTYRVREIDPDQLTVGELKSAIANMNGISKNILKDWLDSLFFD